MGRHRRLRPVPFGYGVISCGPAPLAGTPARLSCGLGREHLAGFGLPLPTGRGTRSRDRHRVQSLERQQGESGQRPSSAAAAVPGNARSVGRLEDDD